jgi:2-keto-4-pentenoate hydratase/2-oxohepta-3-ene-1,7-dioic acid hydratase in catechol pathway
VVILAEVGEQLEISEVPELIDGSDANPLELVASLGYEGVAELLANVSPRLVPRSALTILPLVGEAHIAAATNYADHQEETDSSEVFLFPKLGAATEEPTKVATGPDVLLDYEIEICALFDRDVATPNDFDAAVKGFFLCSDFTDRATLLRLIDLGDMANGAGFTEGKSGAGRFAVGDRLVIPRDWRSFIDHVPLRLSVDGELKQRALGADMLLKLDEIVAMALQEGEADRWRYEGSPVPLLDAGVIARGQAILTGTPGGVAMQIPSPGWLILKFLKWLFTLAWLDTSLRDFMVDEFVVSSAEQGTFLQPGQSVEMSAGPLGSLTVAVFAD